MLNFKSIILASAAAAFSLSAIAQTELDVLVVYDDYSKNRLNHDVDAYAADWVATTNAIYEASGINFELNLVGTEKQNDALITPSEILLDARSNSQIASWRNQHKADFVVKLSNLNAPQVASVSGSSSYTAYDLSWKVESTGAPFQFTKVDSAECSSVCGSQHSSYAQGMCYASHWACKLKSPTEDTVLVGKKSGIKIARATVNNSGSCSMTLVDNSYTLSSSSCSRFSIKAPSLCGLALGSTSASANSAFSVVDPSSSCSSRRAFAHEIGHNMGLAHDRLDLDANGNPKTGVESYARGHGIVGDFATIMAYPSRFSTNVRVDFFSNPNIQLCGFSGSSPCGVPQGQTDEADAVSVLNDRASNYESFR